MLIIGIVCDLGVRGVRHKGALKPLNELALREPRTLASS